MIRLNWVTEPSEAFIRTCELPNDMEIRAIWHGVNGWLFAMFERGNRVSAEWHETFEDGDLKTRATLNLWHSHLDGQWLAPQTMH